MEILGLTAGANPTETGLIRTRAGCRLAGKSLQVVMPIWCLSTRAIQRSREAFGLQTTPQA